MKRLFMPAAGGLLLALAAAATSCGEDYPPYGRLSGLRVLAIKSEPVAPAFGEASLLTPLAFAAPGEAISYAWSWCPFPGPTSANAPCLLPEAALRAQVAMRGGPEAAELVPAYDLGTGDTITFANVIPTALIVLACEKPKGADGGAPDAGANMDAGAAPLEFPPVDCTNGFPIQIKMVATTPTDSVTTIRTLNLTYDPKAYPNTNPQISNLTAQLLKRDKDRDPKVAGDQFESPPQELSPTAPPIVALRQREMRLNVVVTPESSELSKDRDEFNELKDSKERLYISWFVDSGTVSDERTGFIDNKTTVLADALKNIWRPSSVKKFAGTQSKVVVVVRDNRGGVNWTWGTANLVEGAL